MRFRLSGRYRTPPDAALCAHEEYDGCSADGSRRIVFFGTDFGTERYWEEDVVDGRGEKQTQPTLRNLDRLVEEAGIDPCSCHLTNSVLALARHDDMTGNDRFYKQYPDYLKQCADFHHEWISSHAVDLVVLMGTPNVEAYRRLTFQRIFPVLERAWQGLEKPWTSMYERHKELVVTEPGEPDVLWMFHPVVQK